MLTQVLIIDCNELLLYFLSCDYQFNLFYFCHCQGDKWQLFIPSELAYGERQQGRYITPGAVLLFDIEIVKVRSGGYVRDTSGDL